MNILMTLSQLEVTGAEVFAVSIADELISRGNKVFIISDTLTKKTQARYIPVPLSKRTLLFRIKNVIFLKKFIRENNIHIVNAHSRASAWVSSLACWLTKIPLVVFIHGRQATFLSRKIFHAYGNYTLPICEKLQDQLSDVFKVHPDKIEVFRNCFDLDIIKPSQEITKQKTVSFITRLSGPKGDLAYKLLEYISTRLNEFKDVKFQVVGGQVISERFQKFTGQFEFRGFVENLEKVINESSVVIGSGRIAIETILLNKPLIAIGEACTIGLVKENNLNFVLKTNFGDMNVIEKVFDFEKIINDLKLSLDLNECDKKVFDKVREECDLKKNVSRLEFIFQSVVVRYYKKEIPIIYYHRIVESLDEAGKHGIYVTAGQFEKHLSYLKKSGYKTITFGEALEIKRSGIKGKYVIITFDDGYEDNHRLAFPVLKKYGFKAIIFLVAGLEYNSWDLQSNEPKLKMMNKSQLLEMQDYGIEFGSHTLSHSDLTKISLEEAKKELDESKKILEEKLGREIKSFAFPYGNCNEEVKKIARLTGYKLVYATDNAPLGLHEDLFQIRRIGIFPNTTVRGLARKVKGNYIFKREKKYSQYLRIPT
ncbi:MAG: polysaccharide deacetylase family protein [Ignavibacteriales bacterium]|nr:polysaccharide deacetylase family protein [Ignavibacteriales bacterium]